MNYISSMKDYQAREPHRFLVITDGEILGEGKCKRCILTEFYCGNLRSSQFNIRQESLGDSYIYCVEWGFHKREIEKAIKLNRNHEKAILLIIQ